MSENIAQLLTEVIIIVNVPSLELLIIDLWPTGDSNDLYYRRCALLRIHDRMVSTKWLRMNLRESRT